MQWQQQGCKWGLKQLLMSALLTGTLPERSLQVLQQWPGCKCDASARPGAHGSHEAKVGTLRVQSLQSQVF